MTPVKSCTSSSLYSAYNAAASRPMSRARHRKRHRLSLYTAPWWSFSNPNDGFVTFHIGGQVDANATYGVLQDAVDEKCHICHKYTDPV